MPAKKRKGSTAAPKTTKKAKPDTQPVVMPDRSRSAINSLLASDPLYPPNKKKGKKRHEPITIDSDSDCEGEFVNAYWERPHANEHPSRFYSSGTGNFAASPVQQNLNKLFDSYRGTISYGEEGKCTVANVDLDQPKQNPDKILVEGVQKYLSDLSIALDEVVVLALCDLLSCPSIGEFDREAFVSGWTAASTPTSNTDNAAYTPSKPLDSVSRQREYMATLRKRLPTDPAYFKTIYRSSFKLAKANESSRSVPLESAIDFWKMFFSSSTGGIEWNSKSTPWLDLWCEFYEKQGKRPVNKDLWNMVGELVQKTKEPNGENLEWWTEDGAWPMAVDEFVAWLKEKRKAEGVDEMDTS